MEFQEITDNLQVALMGITAELMGRLWREHGPDAIPCMAVHEGERYVEVIRSGVKPGEYFIDIWAEKRRLTFVYDEAKMHDINGGIVKYDFGETTNEDLRVASGLMMQYYAQAMAD